MARYMTHVTCRLTAKNWYQLWNPTLSSRVLYELPLPFTVSTGPDKWYSVLWRCWLGGRKGIRPVKTEWWGVGVVICWSEVQTCSCIWPSWCRWHSLSLASVKSRLVLPFWYRLTWVVPEKGPLNGCVCVCVCTIDSTVLLILDIIVIEMDDS